MTTIPQMTLRGFNLESALVEWEDETHEYFVWVHRSVVQNYVGKKSKEKKAIGPRGRMRDSSVTLDLNAKKNAALKEAVHALATPEAVRAALDAEQVRYEAEKAANAKARRINGLRDAVNCIVATSADEIAEALDTASPIMRLAVLSVWETGQ